MRIGCICPLASPASATISSMVTLSIERNAKRDFAAVTSAACVRARFSCPIWARLARYEPWRCGTYTPQTAFRLNWPIPYNLGGPAWQPLGRSKRSKATVSYPEFMKGDETRCGRGDRTCLTPVKNRRG